MFFELFSNFHNENHIPPLSKNVSEVVLGSSVQAKCRYIIPRGPSNFYSLVSRFPLLPRSILKVRRAHPERWFLGHEKVTQKAPHTDSARPRLLSRYNSQIDGFFY